MKKKINLRMMLVALVAVVISAVGVTVIYYSLFVRQVRSDLRVSADLLRDTGYFEIADPDTSSIDLTTGLSALRVTWVAADGTVLYDNDVSAAALENHADRPEIREAFEEGEGESVRRSDTFGKNTFYYAVRLNNGTVLRAATDAETIWSVFLSAMPLVILILALVIILCLILSHYLTRQLIRPIETMAGNIGDTSAEPPYRELAPFAETIRKQHEDILSAAKMRQDFTANVSHELKTPLTAISGYAELIENHMVGPEQETHFLQEIRRNSDRLLSLINDIIRLSELDRSEKEPAFEEIDICEIVSGAMENLRVAAQKRAITLHFEGEKCTTRGNREMIRELTDNLVQNAVRYNNEGGQVWVTVKGSGEKSLTVKDNGIGIPKQDQSRVFERFYRVDKSRSKATGGTGLGLAIVKHIVEIHEASIDLESEPGTGTTIKVTF